MYDYEKLLYDTLMSVDGSFKDRHLWCLKSTGLGVSEFFLRLMAWLCTSTDDYKNSQMVVVTGPNLSLAVKLMKRLKGIFSSKLGIYFTNKETMLELNGCQIEAYPSNHIDSFRSLTNPKFILLDESDFWIRAEVDEVRDVAERYIGKSDPYIAMISTPHQPGGLFDRIDREPEETCLYKRLKLSYEVGLGKIYTDEEIEKAKHSPSFEREYMLKFLGGIGNVFTQSQVDACVNLGEQYKHMAVNPYCIHSIGVDPGFGSSNTAVVATEFLPEPDNKIRVIFSEEYEHADPQAITNLMFKLYLQYGADNTFLFIDGSSRAMVNLAKLAWSESLNWEKSRITPDSMKVLPVNFATDHKQMLSDLVLLVSKSYLCIPKQFDRLQIALKTAYANELSLDKNRSSFSDSLDALRLACKMYKMK